MQYCILIYIKYSKYFCQLLPQEKSLVPCEKYVLHPTSSHNGVDGAVWVNNAIPAPPPPPFPPSRSHPLHQ